MNSLRMEEAEQYCFEDFESKPIGTGSTTAYGCIQTLSSLPERTANDQPEPEPNDFLVDMTSTGHKRIGCNGYDDLNVCVSSKSRTDISRSSGDYTGSTNIKYEALADACNGTSLDKTHTYSAPVSVNSMGGGSVTVSGGGFISQESEKKLARTYLPRQSASVDENLFSVRTRATPSIVHTKSKTAKWTVDETREVKNEVERPARNSTFSAPRSRKTSTSLVGDYSIKDKAKPYFGLNRSTTVDIPSIGCSSTDSEEEVIIIDDPNYIPFDLNKLSVRARPDTKLNSKTKDATSSQPPVRTGASSPRNWNFATQSIVPRFANRDDSEIVSAIRKSPVPRVGDSKDRRRPVMTTARSIDSSLTQLNNSNHKGCKMTSPNNMTRHSYDKMNFYGPEDFISGIASECSLLHGHANHPVNKEKRRQCISMGSLGGIMGKGLPSKGDGNTCATQQSGSEHNGHKPICRSLTAPAASGSTVEEQPGIRAKIPVGARVSAPLLGISSGGSAWRLEDDETANPPPAPSLDDTPFAGTSSQLYFPMSRRSLTPEVKKSNRSNVKLGWYFSQKGDRHITGNRLQRNSRDEHKSHSLESLVQTDLDLDKASRMPLSPSNPAKLQRSRSYMKRNGSNTEMDGTGGKGDREKNRALFEAVEHQELEAARLALEAYELDINQVNEEEFTALDIAVMINNIAMATLLLSYGARDNPKFLLRDIREAHLNTLINDAERQVQEFTTRIINTTNNNNIAGNSKDVDKQLKDWEWRHKLYKRMKAGFKQARIPDPPASVTVLTTSSSSLLVQFDEPINFNGAAVTRYKVEWSQNDEFFLLCGEHILYDVRDLSYMIQGLEQSVRYYVRVSAFNMKGFGSSQVPDPPYAVPSSWRDMDDSRSRSSGKLSKIYELFQVVRDARPTVSGEMKASSPRASPNEVRKTLRKSLKHFFQSAPKFQKNLGSRVVYLASMLYSEDKILVTTEDCLPIVEVAENFSSNLHQEFLWFMKVASTWEDVDAMRLDLERSNASSSSVVFRGQMLNAASQLQSSLGLQDLGQLYYEPVRDQHGSTVITLIKEIKDSRIIQTASLKWCSISRMQKRKTTITTEVPTSSAVKILVSSIQAKILYHINSRVALTKGLYIGYLKLRSSMDTIQVQVPQKTPNVVPHIKMRDNPNVSQEEWEWLHSSDNCEVTDGPTRAQVEFLRNLEASCKKLLKKMGVSDEEAIAHRICDLEVIELNNQVSMIMLFPPTSSVCLGPGTGDEWLASEDYIPIQVHLFEIIHMATYHGDFIRRYTRLSSILEMDVLIAQHKLREAFSDEEVKETKARQDQITDFQTQLDSTWKGMRWIMDVVQYARDKQIRGGVPLSALCTLPPSPVKSPADSLNRHRQTYQSCR